jgi:diguanylate cyclase (GGDEF)-like protein
MDSDQQNWAFWLRTLCAVGIFLEISLSTVAMDSLDLRVSQHDARLSIHALLNQAQASLESNPRLSLELAKAAQNAAGSIVYLSGLAEALVAAAKAEQAQGQSKEAIESLSQARQLYVDLENQNAELEVLLELNRLHRIGGNMVLAGECLNRALDLSRQIGRREAEAEALNGLAVVSLTLGDVEQATAHLSESLEIWRSIGNFKGEISCLSNLGALHTQVGKYATAVELLSSAYALIQERMPDPELEANCLINIGNIYQDQGEYPAALIEYHRGLGIAHAAKLRSTELTALTNLAETHLLAGSPREALSLYTEVQLVARQHGFPSSEIDALEGIGRANIDLKRPEEALEAIRQALSMSRVTTDHRREILLLLDLSRTKNLLSDRNGALEAAREAIGLAQQTNAKKLLHDAEYSLSGLLEASGDLEGSFAHYKRAHDLEKELFNEESERKLQGLKARVGLERAQAEAEAYRERTLKAQRANETLEQKVLERTRELEDAQIETVTRLALAAEYRDDSTGQHTHRVGDLAALLAEALGLPEVQVNALRIAARLHDVGKIGVSDLILLKPDKLTADEFEHIKNHTVIGAQILSGGRSPILRLAEQIALSHHERWDGTGYPNGLVGEAIPLPGRIVAVADVYDALVSERPYKRAWTQQEALIELEVQSGKMFDPQIIQVIRVVFAKEPGVDVGKLEPLPEVKTTQAVNAVIDDSIQELDHILDQAWAVRNGETQRCILLSQEALSRAVAIAYRRGIGLGRRNLGFGHFVAAEYEQAIDAFSEGLEIGRELEDHALLRDCSNYLGAVYSSLGDYATAIEYVQATLDLSRLASDDEGIASALTNLGLLHHYLGHNEQAVGLHQESVRLSFELADQKRQSAALNNLGIALTKLERFDQAAEVLNQVLPLARVLDDAEAEGRALVNLSEVYGHLGRHQEALNASQQALILLRASAGPEGETQGLLAVGLAHFHLGALEASAQNLDIAVQLAEATHSKALAHQLHRQLAVVKKSLGQLDAAFSHYERHHVLERELSSDEAERKVRATTAQREAERARAESEIFRLRNIELARAVSSFTEVDKQKSELLRELHEKSIELERQVQEDALTGLFNRRYLETNLADEFVRCRLNRLPLCVAMIDVDHFKQVNDTYSHMVGDRVLVQIAKLLQNSSRGRDMVARYGGEEFVVAMPATTKTQALVACERMRQAVEDFDWSSFHPDLRLTISIGLADDRNMENHEKQLHLADARLYEAKRLGRNCLRWNDQS